MFYNCDLIGETVYDAETGEKIGFVTEVEEGVRNLYYIIEGEKRYRVPAIEPFVVKAFPGEGVYLRIIEGMSE